MGRREFFATNSAVLTNAVSKSNQIGVVAVVVARYRRRHGHGCVGGRRTQSRSKKADEAANATFQRVPSNEKQHLIPDAT